MIAKSGSKLGAIESDENVPNSGRCGINGISNIEI
jgi:hypothetical protein